MNSEFSSVKSPTYFRFHLCSGRPDWTLTKTRIVKGGFEMNDS